MWVSPKMWSPKTNKKFSLFLSFISSSFNKIKRPTKTLYQQTCPKVCKTFFLPRFDRDGLMNYVDEVKYKRFIENHNNNLKRTVTVNCDIIHNVSLDNPLQREVKEYQQVKILFLKTTFKLTKLEQSKVQIDFRLMRTYM